MRHWPVMLPAALMRVQRVLVRCDRRALALGGLDLFEVARGLSPSQRVNCGPAVCSFGLVALRRWI